MQDAVTDDEIIAALRKQIARLQLQLEQQLQINDHLRDAARRESIRAGDLEKELQRLRGG